MHNNQEWFWFSGLLPFRLQSAPRPTIFYFCLTALKWMFSLGVFPPLKTPPLSGAINFLSFILIIHLRTGFWKERKPSWVHPTETPSGKGYQVKYKVDGSKEQWIILFSSHIFLGQWIFCSSLSVIKSQWSCSRLEFIALPSSYLCKGAFRILFVAEFSLSKDTWLASAGPRSLKPLCYVVSDGHLSWASSSPLLLIPVLKFKTVCGYPWGQSEFFWSWWSPSASIYGGTDATGMFCLHQETDWQDSIWPSPKAWGKMEPGGWPAWVIQWKHFSRVNLRTHCPPQAGT